MNLQQYYNDGRYLDEHKSFFKKADLEKEVKFLIKALGLRKQSSVLDIACGNGRHLNVLNNKGYQVDGVDYSKSLLKIAEEDSKNSKHHPHLFHNRIEKFKTNNKYDHAYWFFSDMADINYEKALFALNGTLKTGGKILIDTDNLFRLLFFMARYKKKDLAFDAKSLELKDKKNNITVTYLTVPQWSDLLKKVGFKIEKVFGDYDAGKLTIKSPRLIIVAKKFARVI